MGALRQIPPLGRWTLGAHFAWGAFVVWGYSWLGEAVAVARPVIVTAWFGTTAMFLIFGLAPAAILVELLRTA